MLKKTLHLLAALNRRLRLSRCIPAPVLQTLRARVLTRLVANLPDRVYLEQDILPCLAQQPWKRILFVGCEPYTQGYGRQFTKVAIEYWTTDIKPDSSAWGEPHRHRTGNVCELDRFFENQMFDAVLLNGVFGFGVNEIPKMDEAIRAIQNVLVPRGILLLGWNRELMRDPSELNSIQEGFEHRTYLPLPERKTFVDVTHIFDMFTVLPKKSG